MDALNLDPTLVSTWKGYTEKLKTYLARKEVTEALTFIEEVDQFDLPDNASDFIVYKALANVMNEDLNGGLSTIQKALSHGFKTFWKFDRNSKAWVDHSDPDYILLNPIHHNTEIQKWIAQHYSVQIIPWGFDITQTPLCLLRQAPLRRENVRCYISKKKLKKGEPVYEFQFFNGSHDTPSNTFFAHGDAVNSNKSAMLNIENYRSNSYRLNDYAFKTDYTHPLVSSFWNQLDRFDLDAILQIIANPPVHPTPYLAQPLHTESVASLVGTNLLVNTDRQIYYGTGGIFANLLYILIKCGYQQDIIRRLPTLPDHFPLLLMCFNDTTLRRSVAAFMGYTGLADLYEQALSPHTKKTPQVVKNLVDFGHKNPDFRRQLAKSLDLYEYHLYSNYRPGINWLFESFDCYKNARGGGLLDFLISEPELLPV
ncbi:hypothetical protein [Dyadobacter fermentans]|uniref:Uncharacterized protein n=1 Tax=Dyadobacter fermentans (strain ATCC 700827 / DSM 18053 / CIP 107007 / KCTC 52180 / NS114) TaxID=471854 RepID=C6W4X9_DYAFD|nr:hypothetical protein [Dyadobacter fermentans]ACT95953.1 hypothetical protein Dfer_4752 [Dyadobacter fermentans DSM 18053]